RGRMDWYKIVAGFSYIKLLLIEKCDLNKTVQELNLWFSYENEVTYAHDKQNHIKNIPIAIYENDFWYSRLVLKSFGDKLLRYAITLVETDAPKSELAQRLNKLYEEYGYYN